MRIDAITCCVGEKYAAYLRESLPIWLDTVDSLTVVTRNGIAMAGHLGEVMKSSKIKLAITDAFYSHGAAFNKAAALNVAYHCASPTDWVLHFDSDILPPENWRAIAEGRIKSGELYGAFRYTEDGQRLDEAPLFPYGYFHLWDVADPCSWRWPIFEPWHGHAGNYDANFAEQWPYVRRRDLGFQLTHKGQPRRGWFGVEESPKMLAFNTVGLHNVRKLSRSGIGNLNLPEPKAKLALINAESNVDWTLGVLRICSAYGPFLSEAVMGLRDGYTTISPTVPLSYIQELVEQCIRS